MFVDDYQYISFCLLQLECKASLSYTTCTSMETSLVPDIAYIYCTVPNNIILNSIQHIPLCNLNTIYRFSREQRLIKAYLVYTVYTSHFLDLIKCSREAVPLLPWLAIKGGFSEGTKDKSMWMKNNGRKDLMKKKRKDLHWNENRNVLYSTGCFLTVVLRWLKYVILYLLRIVWCH